MSMIVSPTEFLPRQGAGCDHRQATANDLAGTPLHELWLRDPTGYGIEVYARLTPEESKAMPVDQEPTYLVPGTEPGGA